MANIGNGRRLRVCDLCGGVDDHPRQVLIGTTAEAFPAPGDDIVSQVLDTAPEGERVRLLRDLNDTASSERHYDCCAQSGCSHESCRQVVDAAAGKTGKALLSLLTGDNNSIEYGDDMVKGE